jgi:hypothetical protein
MEEEKKRTKWITIYLNESEFKLIREEATKGGKQSAPFCREIVIDYIMKRLVRLENIQQLPQFSQKPAIDDSILKDINEIKEYIHQNSIVWELNRVEKLDSALKINIPLNGNVSERILQILKNTQLFLDQIVEKLTEIGHQLTPREVLKYLAELRQKGKVEQTVELRWFLC